MKKLLFITAFIIPFLAKSQAGLERIELDAALNSDIYQVVPCDNWGVLVFYETKDVAGDNLKSWHFIFYSKDLEQVWDAFIPVVTDADYKDFNVRDSLMTLFFLNTGKVKPGTQNFEFVFIDLAKSVSYQTSGILPSETEFEKILFDHTRAYLALDTKNDQAAVFFIDLKTAAVTAFNVLYPDQNFIEDIAKDTLGNHLLCLVSNYLDRRQNKMYLQTLDLNGQFISDMEISTALDGKYLNMGRLYQLSDSSIMIVGSYGGLAARIPSPTEYFGVESTGMFVTRIIHKKQEFMNYYNFMEFNNLKAGVNARDFYRLQKKKSRETPEYSMNYELLTHQPIIRDSTMVLMVEAFYPEFRTVSDISYDYWGRPVTQTYSVFDGYRIFNTILAGFSFNGELAWDNSLEINISPSMQLLKRSAYYFDSKPSLVFYNDGYRINYRVFLNNTELVGFSKMDLETSRTGDRITAVGYNTITHWYDKYFMAYGYQTIQNNLASDKSERTVFYINKIALD